MDIKHINVFGCGQTAVGFYRKHKAQASIGYALSNVGNELVFSPEAGVEFEVKRPDRKKDKEALIVICCKDYDTVAEQLMLLGYQPFEDFMDYQLAELLLDEKKAAVFYGICHLRGISECLKLSQNFIKEYEIFYYANYLSSSTYRSLRFQYLLKKCELLVYGFEVTANNYQRKEAILKRVPEGIKTLCLPVICFGGYFPQKKRGFNAMNVYAVKSEGYDYTPFSYGDSWLNECIDKGMTLDSVIEALEKTSVYEKDFVLRYLENEWKRFRYQEKLGDFQFTDYIQKHFQDRRLFRNEAHMENDILLYYSRQVLQRLGMKEDLIEIEEPLMKCSQHVIYPSTAKAIGLKWNVLEEKLDLYTYNGWKKVTVVEYIEAYYQYCSLIKQLKAEGLFP